jgi:sialidase-1
MKAKWLSVTIVFAAFFGGSAVAEAGSFLTSWNLSAPVTLDAEEKWESPYAIAYGDYEVSLTAQLADSSTGQLELWIGGDGLLIDGAAGTLTCFSTIGNYTYLDDPLNVTLPGFGENGEFSLAVKRHNGLVTISWNDTPVYEADYKRDTIGYVHVKMRTGQGEVMELGMAGRIPELPESTDLFVKGEGSAYYRIPALVRAPGGTLLAFAEARRDSYHDYGNIDLVVRRSVDNGATWGAIELVYEEGGDETVVCANLSPVVDRDTGRVWVFFLVCEQFYIGEFKLMRMFSDDDGATWSTPEDVRAALCNPNWLSAHPGPGHGIQIERGPHAGRLMICGWYYMDGGMGVFTFYSDDHGSTWQRHEPVAIDPNETMLAERSGGDVMAMMRQPHQSGSLWRLYATSPDGIAWTSSLEIQGFRTTECEASVLGYSELAPGRVSPMMFCMPGCGNFSQENVSRSGLTLRTSLDDGLTWPIAEVVYPGLSAYSDMTRFPDGQVGLLYENGDLNMYERISFMAWAPAAGVVGAFPYAETFEAYPDGFQLPGTNGWLATSPTNAAVTTNSAWISSLADYDEACGYPIDSPCDKVLEVTGAVSNLFCIETNQMVWADYMVLPHHGDLMTDTNSMAGVQAGGAVNREGHPAVWHYDPASGSSCWSVIDDITIPAGEWVRFTYLFDYQTDDLINNVRYFQIRVDGNLLASDFAWTSNDGAGNLGGSWFAMAPGPDRFDLFSLQAGAGTSVGLDDFLVSTDNPLARDLTVVSEQGQADPTAGAYTYTYGDSVSLSVTNEMLTQGVNRFSYTGWELAGQLPSTGSGTNIILTLTNDLTLTWLWSTNNTLTTNGTPEWWLADHGLPIGADTLDSDNDGMLTWQEWVSDTTPNDSNSVLVITGVEPAGSGMQLHWEGGVQATQYLERCTNLVTGSWVALFTNEPPTSVKKNFVDSGATNSIGFYRVKAKR